MSGSSFTCITCHVAFSNADVQRDHYKTDWHRYNLKRKVAELPHVTADRFRERVLAQQAATGAATADTAAASLHCDACRKPFRSAAQYQNHLQSRKHQEQQKRWEADSEAREERRRVADLNRKNQQLSEQPAAASASDDSGSDDDDDMSVEEVDSDEWDEWADEDGIPATTCLFCPHTSGQLAHNLQHMTQAHSFFVPDVEYVTDMEGLLNYLGQKVGVGFVCLWCNERGRRFTSVEACQKHMRDKGHAKMLHEGEVLAEYADFYDYSASYPEGEGEDGDNVEPPALEASGYELVLPSGAVVGHRALARYYRQSLRPEKVVAVRRAGAGVSARDVLKQYRLMGWVGTDRTQLQRTARDMQALRRHQMRDWTRLGTKANKLRHRMRQQNPV